MAKRKYIKAINILKNLIKQTRFYIAKKLQKNLF